MLDPFRLVAMFHDICVAHQVPDLENVRVPDNALAMDRVSVVEHSPELEHVPAFVSVTGLEHDPVLDHAPGE